MYKLNNLNIFDHPELYYDYEISISFLKKLKFEIPKKTMNFHIYTDLKNEKEIESIKSFFATQNLKYSKLNIWSDYQIDKKTLYKSIGDLVDLIDFKIYIPKKLAKDTILENFKYLNINDDKYWLKSDLFRLQVCNKFGGIYIDMDIILLNDLSPLYNFEFFYQWGGSKEDQINSFCASVMKLDKNSKNSLELLNAIKNSKYPRKGTTYWGRDLFKKIKFPEKILILPCAFFDTEWNISLKNPILASDIDNYFFTKKLKNKDLLFLNAFTWHWHNSSYKNSPIMPGSKFDLLRKRNDMILKKKFFS